MPVRRTPSSFRRWRLPAVLLALAVVAACQGTPPEPAAPTTVNVQTTEVTLVGRADMPDAPFGGAAVRVTELADDAIVVATGTTAADGSFQVALPPGLLTGTPLKVTATRDGQTLGAIGAASVRFDGAFARFNEVRLNLASTLALLAFEQRLRAVALAIKGPTTQRINFDALQALLLAFQKLELASQSLLPRLSKATTDGISRGNFVLADGEKQALEAESQGATQDLIEAERQAQPTPAPTPDATATPAEPTPAPTSAPPTPAPTATPRRGGGGSGGPAPATIAPITGTIR